MKRYAQPSPFNHGQADSKALQKAAFNFEDLCAFFGQLCGKILTQRYVKGCSVTQRKCQFVLLCSAFIFSYQSAKAQQDPLYNLYSFNQFMVNPAYAGIYNNFNANLITRKQWAGIEGSPLTNMLSLHSSVANQFGAGLLLVNDRLGINNNLEGQVAFSYKLVSGEKTLAFGVQGGFINYSYDYNKLNTPNLGDPSLEVQEDKFSKANFGAGIFYMTDNYYIGFSVPRILNVEVENDRVNSNRYQPHFYLSGGFIIKSQSVASLLFKPSFLVRYTTNKQLAADVSFNALFVNTVWAGVTVRNLDALALTTQLQISRSFRFGYSFEFPTSKLARQNYGTHEISLLVELNLFKNQYAIERYF